jgi:hypothetical protein
MKVSRWPLLSLLLPLLMAGVGQGPAPAAGFSAVAPSPAVFVSAPRQSIPRPVHDEATCAFCQAAAFAPHASSPRCDLYEDTGSAHQELVSRDERLIHSESSRPPRSRAPPTIRVS